jgi:iron complex outermembrane receptor protein
LKGKIMKTSIIALASVLAAVSPAQANAEDAGAAAEAKDGVIIVTAPSVTLAAEQQAASTPGGTDVVSYEDYADRFPVSLRDVLSL